MSAAKFSNYLQRKLIPLIKKRASQDIRNIVETQINYIRFTQKNIDDMMKLYGWDNKTATEALNYIIQLADKDPNLERVADPKNKNVFKPVKVKGRGRLKLQYKQIQKFKTSLGKKLQDKFGAGEEFGQEFHLGHGASSFSVVHYLGLEAGKRIQKFAGANSTQFKEFEKGLNSIFTEEKAGPSHAIDLSASIKQTFTEGVKFRRNYIIYLDLQLGEENLEEGRNIERKFRDQVLELLDKVASEWPGSKASLYEISDSLDKSLRGKKGLKSKNYNQKTNKISLSKQKATSKVTPGKSPAKSNMRTARGQFTSPIALMNLINARLHDMVKKNMKSPALNYQTGRFARSVRVTSISQTRQQQMTAFYTYMKSPYQTFERGYAQGSPQRDPRTLISRSIRDAAAQIMGTKFEIRTRRV